jgi:hypothetical protein
MAENRQLNLILELKDNATKELGAFQGKLKSLTPTFQKMAAFGTAAFVGVSAVIGKTTQEAARAEGTWNKFNTVFGDGADQMRDFIDDLRKEMPTATHEIARMAADLQDLIIPMGIGRQEAQGMTKEMVVLANKLAAFNDVDPTEVLEAFKSGLAGSSEPLRRFGINALDSSIEAHALANGIGNMTDGFKELDPVTKSQVRAQALISLAYEQSSDAISGFAANNDSLIRRQQNLKANFKEISATIGEIFIPIVDDLVKKLLPVVEKFREWAEENPKIVKWILIGTVAVSGLIAVIGVLGLALTSVMGIMAAVVTLGLLPIIVTIGTAIATIGSLIAIAWYLNKNWGDLWYGMQLVTAQIANAITNVYEKMINFIISGLNSVIDIANKLINQLAKIPGMEKIVSKLEISRIADVSLGRIDTDSIVQASLDPNGMAGKSFTGALSEQFGDFVTDQGAFSGNNGGNVVNINGGIFGSDAGEELGNMIIKQLELRTKL